MKLLGLSDLHQRMNDISDVIHQKRFTPFLQSIRDVVEDTMPDVIVVTGDTVPTSYVVSLKAFFGNLFPSDIPVIATLGNHEFWARTFEETLENARNQNADALNVHILDAEPSVVIDGYNFVGGCLFFDGSMRWREDDDLLPWDGWQDWRIPDIETHYKEFNAYYVERIRQAMKPNMPHVLCTHHLPHVALNGFEPSHYSYYSGMKDLVSQLPFDNAFPNALICGHTHKRVIGEVVPGFYCVNVGSDYGVLNYYLLELFAHELGLSEAFTELIPEKQRCQWHTVRDLYHMMRADGGLTKESKPYQDRLAALMAIELPKEDFAQVDDEEKRRITELMNSSELEVSKLIDELQVKGYDVAVNYLTRAVSSMFGYVKRWLRTGLIGYKASSMVERVMRAIGRRIKKIAYGWKEKGVCKMAKILLKRFADETEWTSYWDKLFFATK